MNYKGKDYKMVLNLDAVCAMEEAGLNLSEVLKGGLNITSTVTLARCMLNAGAGEEVFTDRQLRNELYPGALKGIYDEIKAAMEQGMKMEHNEDKPRDVVLDEIDMAKKPTA